jgi:TonB family protein
MFTARSPFAASIVIHAAGILLLLSMVTIRIPEKIAGKRRPTFVDFASYHRALRTREPDGGGGDRSPIPVSRGSLPKQSPRPFAPPMIVTHESPLLVEPALLTISDVNVNLPQWGDPLATAGPYSNGPGDGGGQGGGHNGGVGDGHGQQYRNGPEYAVQPARGSFSPPLVIYKVDPEFSEEARRAKYQGSVLLMVDVDTTGRASNVRILKSVGLGLDEKAVEAVSRWRFRPAIKDGKPVTVPAAIEVNFHLL